MIVVTTDQEWIEHLECYGVAFEAVRLGEPWNGFATPVMTEATLKVFIARLAFWATLIPEIWLLEISGKYRPALYINGEDGPEFVAERDADGNYDLGNLGWTFTAFDTEDEDEDEPARICMTVNKEGRAE